MTPPKYIIGVDEVGRGPLAGPVAVCAVALSGEQMPFFVEVRDSKQISAKVREGWCAKAKEAGVRVKITFVSAAEIDRIGIAHAIRTATHCSIQKLEIAPNECEVLLDGGLHAPEEFVRQKTIIHGDATQPAISLASCIAKVARDARMVVFAEKFPEYGFERHKGYGTAAHYAAIKQYGLCEIHRKSFLRSFGCTH